MIQQIHLQTSMPIRILPKQGIPVESSGADHQKQSTIFQILISYRPEIPSQLCPDIIIPDNIIIALPLQQQLLLPFFKNGISQVSPILRGIVEFSIQAQGHLFFRLCHISTGCRCSRWAGHPGCRTAPPAGWTPWLPCARHPALPPCSRSDDPAPFPPCPQRRPRSSCGHQ